MDKLNRRMFLNAAALAGGTVVAGTALGDTETANLAGTEGLNGRPPRVRILEAKTSWKLPPAQAPATEGVATLPGGARLYYWDTGGRGDPIVLAHAATGSAASWEYQQPAFARAGLRVIGYSARGKYRSDPPTPGSPFTGSGDLHELLQFLRVDRFHLLGVAAGGGIALDYAVSHPERLLSLMIANSFGGISDPDFSTVTGQILSPGFFDMPADFRELGPSYRSAFRPGVARWLELVELAGNPNIFQPPANSLTWPTVETVRVPTLVLTGDADLYMPSPRVRDFVRHFRSGEATVIQEVGHSAAWEQPEVFNAEILRFVKKHCGNGW